MIRKAKPEDLDALCSLAKRFVSETSLPLTFDAELSRNTFWNLIHNGIILVDDDGVIAGVITGAVDRDFCVEPVAYITKMYIEREFRGLGSSRDLLKAFEEEVSKLGAKIIFASATAGMGERVEKLYVRLFERAGYKVLGRVLAKEI